MKAGWKTVKMGEVCSFERGLTYSKSDEAEAPGITVLRANNVDLDSGRLNLDDLRYISAKVAVDEKKYLSANSIIVCTASGSRDHLGKTAHISKPPRMTFGGFMGLLKPSPEIDSLFLFYLTRSDLYRSFIAGLSSGTNINNLKGSDLLSWEIPLPPLAEQKRIVALLDQAFEGIDEAKANTEANLEKATAVFESHLQSLFAINNPEWARAKLSSLTTKIGSGATPRGGEESYKDEGVSLIRSLNVHDYGFKYAKLAFLDAVQAEELAGVTVQENDVLLNITGASVARCTIVPRGVLPARVNQHVAIIRPIPEKVSSAFLHYLLISQPYKSRLLETGEEGGSTRQAITKAQLLEFTISHPVSVETQLVTAKHLDEVREQTQRLSQLHKQRLDALSALKQSILSQAFAGELTA